MFWWFSSQTVSKLVQIHFVWYKRTLKKMTWTLNFRPNLTLKYAKRSSKILFDSFENTRWNIVQIYFRPKFYNFDSWKKFWFFLSHFFSKCCRTQKHVLDTQFLCRFGFNEAAKLSRNTFWVICDRKMECPRHMNAVCVNFQCF